MKKIFIVVTILLSTIILVEPEVFVFTQLYDINTDDSCNFTIDENCTYDLANNYKYKDNYEKDEARYDLTQRDEKRISELDP